MKLSLSAIGLVLIVALFSCKTSKSIPVQTSTTPTYSSQEVIDLSKQKWLWMAEKNADTLKHLLHNNAMFVHMGGSWGKERELDVINSGGIHYKHAEIQDYSVKFIDNAAFVYNKIRLTAVVGGNEVINPFMVTEVYLRIGNEWKLGSMALTRLMGN